MNVVQKIYNLMQDNNWTIYRLAELSEVNESTLKSMFSRHSLPSIENLEKICNAFGITLSEFFDENIPDDELLLIQSKYKTLNEKRKTLIKELIKELQ